MGKYEEAIKCYDKVPETNPQYALAWNNKGAALSNLGKHDKAISCYEKAIEIDPQSALAWSNKGISLFNLGKYDEAITCYEKASEIDPQFAWTWHDKGLALNYLGKYEEAISCYEKAITIDTQFALAWNNKGVALSNLGKHDKAISCYEKAIKIDTQFTLALYNKVVDLVKLDKDWEALEFYKTITIKPEDVETWCAKGAALDNLGRHDEAITCYDEAIGIKDNDALAWNNKGVALDNLGKYEEAIKCYDKVIYKIDNRFAETWYNKGTVLLKTGNVEKAGRAFDKAHIIDPNNYEYWKGWVTSLYEDGNLDRGLYICKKGIAFFNRKDERSKKNALKELFYQKGVILTKQGKSDDSLIAFREASRNGNDMAKQAINRLIETKAGWWEWWFSDVQSKNYFLKFTSQHLFFILLIALHLSGLFCYFYHDAFTTNWEKTLAFLCGASLIALLFVNPKALLGVTLIEILIAMLIIPITLKDFSVSWQIWIASIAVILFALFHKSIVSIKTPVGEVEMPGTKATPEFSMSELKPK